MISTAREVSSSSKLVEPLADKKSLGFMAQDKLMSSGVRELLIFQPLLGLPHGVSTLACGSRLSTLRGCGGPVLCGPRILEALVIPSLPLGESVAHSQTPGLPTEGGSLGRNIPPLTVAHLHFDWIWGGSTFGDCVQGNHRTPQF